MSGSTTCRKKLGIAAVLVAAFALTVTTTYYVYMPSNMARILGFLAAEEKCGSTVCRGLLCLDLMMKEERGDLIGLEQKCGKVNMSQLSEDLMLYHNVSKRLLSLEQSKSMSSVNTSLHLENTNSSSVANKTTQRDLDEISWKENIYKQFRHEERLKLEHCTGIFDVADQDKYPVTTTAEEYFNVMFACNSKPQLLSQKSIPFSELPVHDATLKVPNVVHYVRFGKYAFKFMHYLNFLSVHKFVKPWFIFLHGDAIPTGEWWLEAIKTIPNIYFIRKEAPASIYDKKFIHVEHKADITRLRALLQHGGMYFDQDVFVLKPLEPLRKFDMTMGRERSNGLANSIMLARPHAAFLHIWMESYHSFKPGGWAQHSVEMPHKLAAIFPHLIHVEARSLVHPTWMEMGYFYNNKYDWTNNYAVHIWSHLGKKIPASPAEIKTYDCMLGQIMRFIYYGSKDIRKD